LPLRKLYGLNINGEIIAIPGVYDDMESAEKYLDDNGIGMVWIVDREALAAWHMQISELMLPVDESLEVPEDDDDEG
jgi:hypothetical protein